MHTHVGFDAWVGAQVRNIHSRAAGELYLAAFHHLRAFCGDPGPLGLALGSLELSSDLDMPIDSTSSPHCSG